MVMGLQSKTQNGLREEQLPNHSSSISASKFHTACFFSATFAYMYVPVRTQKPKMYGLCIYEAVVFKIPPISEIIKRYKLPVIK